MFSINCVISDIRPYVVRNRQSTGALPPLQSTKILEQVRERIRYLHYSIRTEESYLYWIRNFIRWSGVRHPREMDADEVRAYLTYLATKRDGSASTHRVALSSILFLYQKVLDVELPWLDGLARPSIPRRLPVVLTREEVAHICVAVRGLRCAGAHVVWHGNANHRGLATQGEGCRFRTSRDHHPREQRIQRPRRDGAEEAANSLRALVASAIPVKGFGSANRTRYSNAIVDQLLTDALQTMDDERRNELLGRAIRFAMTDQPLIPVFYSIFDFAAKKGLVVTPRAQRRFNALMIRPVGK